MAASGETRHSSSESLFDAHAASYPERIAQASSTYLPPPLEPGGFTEHPQARNPIGLRYVLRRVIRERMAQNKPLEGSETVIEIRADAMTPAHAECFEATLQEFASMTPGGSEHPSQSAPLEVPLSEGWYLTRRTTADTDGLYLSSTSSVESPEA